VSFATYVTAAGIVVNRKAACDKRKRARRAFEKDSRHRGEMNRHVPARRAVPLRQGPVAKLELYCVCR